MPKYFMYEIREQNDLFHEQITIDLAQQGIKNINPVQKARMLPATERLAMFQKILNRYGEIGWKFHSSIMFNGEMRVVFEKETYKKTSD